MTIPFIRPLPTSPQQMTRQQFVLNDFSGGLNNVDNESLIADNQMCDCLNMMYADNNTVEKRYGTTYEYEARTTDTDNINHAITWYDVYKHPSNTDYIITASDSKFYINDEYKFDVNGRIKGVNYNGSYFYVDGTMLYKLVLEGDTWHSYKYIEDPKFYIDSFPRTHEETLLWSVIEEEVSKDVYKLVGPDDVYDSNTDYYADAYGKAKLEHGEENGQVNALNYEVYYTKTVETNTEKVLNIYGVKATYMLPNIIVGDKFRLNTNEFAYDTIADVKTEVDVITGIAKAFVTTKTKGKQFEISNIDYDNLIVTFTSPIKIYNSDMKETWKVYETKQEEEKNLFLENALNEKFTGTLCRCYEPRDNTFNDGAIQYGQGDYIWYEPCQNELDYGFLGENYLPSNPRSICVYNSRLCTTGDYGQNNEVRMSNVNQPAYFPSALSISVNPNGDIIKDMFEFDGALIVAREKDIYAIYGNSSNIASDNMFYAKKLDTTVGIMGANCGAIMNNFFIFIANDGKLYKMTTPTTNTEYLMVRPITTFIDLFKKPLNLTREQMQDCFCIAYKNCIYWLIGDKIVVYSYDHMAFTYFSGWKATSLYTDGIDFFFGDVYGNRCKWNKMVYNDCGKSIRANVRTKTYTMYSPVSYKYFEQVCMTFGRHITLDSDISIQIFADNRKRVIRDIHPIYENSLYDDAEWDINHFASLPYQKTDWMMLNFRSRTISFLFENNNIDESFKIIDCNVIYTGRDIR